jgi:hypothetical protein
MNCLGRLAAAERRCQREQHATMMGSAALLCVASLLLAVDGNALDDSTIRTAVAAWLSDSAAAEAAYGHISTWETGGVTDMSNLFCATPDDYSGSGYCNTAWASFNEDIGAWDTSGVTTMHWMFYEAYAFNRDIGGWAVHNVKDMRQIFKDAKAFNQDIGDWAVHSVTSMEEMFYGASAFNQDIGGWTVDSVTDMRLMFYGASVFDQDLGWCVDTGVTLDEWAATGFSNTLCESTSCGVVQVAGGCAPTPHPSSTPSFAPTTPVPSTGLPTPRPSPRPTSPTPHPTKFNGLMTDTSIRTAVAAWLSDSAAAEAAYGHISAWVTSGVTDMSYLFCALSQSGYSHLGCNPAAASFDEDIGAWDTSGVTSMKGMFWYASAFNRYIGGWAVQSVKDMAHMFLNAPAFNQDIGGWAIDSVTDMSYMFYGAWDFDQDLGWCVNDGRMDLSYAFYVRTNVYSGCAPTSCGVKQCLMSDSSIRTAVMAWVKDATAAEATYGHISTWDTSGVTHMADLFSHERVGSYALSFNDDISAWDTSGVTSMESTFRGAIAFNQDISGWTVHSVTSMDWMLAFASAFDQDLGWCVGSGVDLSMAFYGTICAMTSCGIIQGTCVPTPAPTTTRAPTPAPSRSSSSSGGDDGVIALIAGATAAAALLLAVGAFFWFYRRRKASTMEKADELSGANPEPSELSAPEEATISKVATSPESLETRAAAKAEGAETVELSSFSTKKLTSFLFGEQEEALMEEEATIPVAPEGEEASTEQLPPPPPRRWFSRAEPEPEPAAPKAEDMYNRIAAWYNEPENAALRARCGAYPERDAFQTWPGFVAVTNAFLDREAG